MLLIIFLGIMTTLAIAQGMLLLFLIRSRGHMLALAGELLKLQETHSEIIHLKYNIQNLSTRCSSIEESISTSNAEPEKSRMINNNVIHLAAVGS